MKKDLIAFAPMSICIIINIFYIMGFINQNTVFFFQIISYASCNFYIIYMLLSKQSSVRRAYLKKMDTSRRTLYQIFTLVVVIAWISTTIMVFSK